MPQFTIWLSTSEREALREFAADCDMSQSYIARLALRQWLGLNTTPELVTGEDEAEEVPRFP